MQINTRANFEAKIIRMSDLSSQIDQVNTQIATGKRIISADDDPIASARVVQLHRAQITDLGLERAVESASSRLSVTDTTLEGVGELLVRAKEIALAGANATLNAADRSTLAADAKNLAEQLLGYANRSDSDGGALFGGARRQGPAYAADPSGKIVWQGAGSAPALALDNTLVATGVEGPAAFAGIAVPGTLPPSTTDAFQLLGNLQIALAEPNGALRNAALSLATDGIDRSIGQIADTRALVGARLNRLENELTRIDAAKLQYSRDLATSEGIDLAGAIARLQRLTTVLSATQQSFVRVTALSLWDDLR